MIDPERLMKWRFADVEQVYSAEFTMLYGMAIGIGRDPLAEHDLRFISELAHGGLHAFPTLAVVLGFAGAWLADPATGVDYSRTVHAEEAIMFHAPLPAAGTVIARHRVVSVTDKGADKGALITYDKDLFDKRDGALLATVRHTTFARGDGGFSGAVPAGSVVTPPGVSLPWASARSVEVPTQGQQALLYRLCGDRNPLHAAPSAARRVGFDRPILHGLCTFGMAAHAVAAICCGHDPGRLQSVAARFASPVIPGDVLVFEVCEADGIAHFRARAKGRERLVLSGGMARLS